MTKYSVTYLHKKKRRQSQGANVSCYCTSLLLYFKLWLPSLPYSLSCRLHHPENAPSLQTCFTVAGLKSWIATKDSFHCHLKHFSGIILKKCFTLYVLEYWIGLCSVLRPLQHSIGYMGDGFYRSKDPTNSIKVLKEMLQNTKKTTKTTKDRYT